jgi:hypothetical protein
LSNIGPTSWAIDDWRAARRQFFASSPMRESTTLRTTGIIDPAKLEPVHIAVVALK